MARTSRHPSGVGRLRGFTLIEILVVVAIIGLLMAILIPALERTRDQAKRAVCASNLHQQSLAMRSYSVDFNGYGPYRGWFSYDISETMHEAYGYGGPYGGTEKTLVNLGMLIGGKAISTTKGRLTQKYLKGWDTLYCPAVIATYKNAPKANPAAINGGLPTLWDGTVSFTYGGYNYALPSVHRGDKKTGSAPRIAEVEIYPRRVDRLDGGWVNFLMQSAKAKGFPAATTDDAKNALLIKMMPGRMQPVVHDWSVGGGPNPHKNGVNASFSDGHVRYVKYNGVTGGTSGSPDSFKLWNYLMLHP